jgi:hypothetical protein
MLLFSAFSHRIKVPHVAVLVALWLALAGFVLPKTSGTRSASAQQSGPPKKPAWPEPPEQLDPVAKYDKAVFEKPVPSDQLAFLNHSAGSASNDAMRDKQFRKRSVIPGCMFHYGWDMPRPDAFEMVLKGSTLPVRIREGRYVMVSGRSGPYLSGRGFIRVDMQDGIVLGGFYFHPTNGEPTPSVTVFSRQMKTPSV